MTDGVDLRSLLERVQKAQGPDRELDKAVHELTGDMISHLGAVPFYTGSVDAAADLFALMFYGRPAWWEINDHKAILDNGDDQEFEDIGPSEGLALLSTILQALIARAEAEEGVGEF